MSHRHRGGALPLVSPLALPMAPEPKCPLQNPSTCHAYQQPMEEWCSILTLQPPTEALVSLVQGLVVGWTLVVWLPFLTIIPRVMWKFSSNCVGNLWIVHFKAHLTWITDSLEKLMWRWHPQLAPLPPECPCPPLHQLSASWVDRTTVDKLQAQALQVPVWPVPTCWCFWSLSATEALTDLVRLIFRPSVPSASVKNWMEMIFLKFSGLNLVLVRNLCTVWFTCMRFGWGYEIFIFVQCNSIVIMMPF